MTEWPKYESHKVVRAAKIVGVLAHDDGGGVYKIYVRPAGAEYDNAPIEEFFPTVDEMADKAEAGAWAVVYDDGYRSVSPAKAFEEGYRKVEDGSLSLRQTIAQCAVQFRSYEQQHLAKTPPDVAKAETNATYAAMCEALLNG